MNIQNLKTKKIIKLILPLFAFAVISAYSYAVPNVCSQTSESVEPIKQFEVSTVFDYAGDFKDAIGEKTPGLLCPIEDAGFTEQSAVLSAESEKLDNIDAQQAPNGGSDATIKEGTKVEEVSIPAERISPIENKLEPKVVLPEKKENVPQPQSAAVVKPKNSISYVIGKPAPILAETRVVNNRNVCAKKNDKPQKSDHNPKGHIDTECCLDPDEIPNSRCYYPPEKYGNLIQKYLAGRK